MTMQRKTVSERLVLTMLLTVALVLGAAGFADAAARDWYVATHATPADPYDSWANAFTNIQDALDVANDGDTIRLAGHTFWLTNQLVWTTAGITMRGGYEALETVPAKLPGTNNPALWPTVITRDSGTIRIMHINGANNSRLDRVTITGGNANIGAGLRIDNSLNVLLSGCMISNNVMNRAGITGGFGGGIYASGSGVTLTNCTVQRLFFGAGQSGIRWRGWKHRRGSAI